MSLFVENLRILKTVSFESISSIQQHFWDLSTQRILTVLKESFQSRKALLKVRKLSLLLHGHNSYSVWEWKTVIYKGIFVDWRSSRIFFFFLFFFLHAYYLAFFLNRNGTEKKSESFETTRRGQTGTYLLKWIANLMLYMLAHAYVETPWWLIRSSVGLANARLVIIALTINRDLK